jgi:hypothetical protein
MQTFTPKPIKKLALKSAVNPSESKPQQKLSKNDPLFYAKIGSISAEKRQLAKEYFSSMAKLSHGEGSKRDGYHGGRKKKQAGAN